MATYNITNTRAALKTLLSAVSGVGIVYDYMNPQIEKYPVVIFDVSNEDSVYLDDVNNTRTITFKIWVAVEISVKGLSPAKDLLDALSDRVINALEALSNQTLSGNADWLLPVVGARDQATSPEGNFLYQELLLKVNIVSAVN